MRHLHSLSLCYISKCLKSLFIKPLLIWFQSNSIFLLSQLCVFVSCCLWYCISNVSKSNKNLLFCCVPEGSNHIAKKPEGATLQGFYYQSPFSQFLRFGRCTPAVSPCQRKWSRYSAQYLRKVDMEKRDWIRGPQSRAPAVCKPGRHFSRAASKIAKFILIRFVLGPLETFSSL